MPEKKSPTMYMSQKSLLRKGSMIRRGSINRSHTRLRVLGCMVVETRDEICLDYRYDGAMGY